MNERIHGGVGQTSGADKPQTGEAQRDTILVDVVQRLDVAQNRLYSTLKRITDFRNRVYPEAPRDGQGSNKEPDDTLTGAIYHRLGRLDELLDWAEQLAEDCEKIG